MKESLEAGNEYEINSSASNEDEGDLDMIRGDKECESKSRSI